TAPASGGGSSERERPESTPAATPRATPIPAPVFPWGQTVAPTAALIPTAAPLVAAAATPTAPRAVAGVQTLPSTSTDEPWSPLVMLGLTLAGVGLLLRGRPVR